MFSGYQSPGPRLTIVGKLLSIVIACIGLPIFFLYICLVGGFLARHLQCVYARLSCSGHPAEQTCHTADVAREYCKPSHKVSSYPDHAMGRPRVPLWICVIIVTSYLLLGSVWVSQYHQVTFIDGFHFCFSLLCTIGVTRLDLKAAGGPRNSVNDSTEDVLSIVITSLYILIGVALVAMCAHFLKQDISTLLESLTHTPAPSSGSS